MKKLLGACSALLAAVTVISMPASAMKILTGDSFGKGSKTVWESDIYDPEEFESDSDNTLYLSVGSKGYTRNRPADKKDKKYAQQGKKLLVETPDQNTWTATIKLNIDDAWFNSSERNKRVEFRVDLMDGDGNPLESGPMLALMKYGAGAPVFKFYNPRVKSGWALGDKYVDGDKVLQEMDIEMGWHTLIINCNKGVIGYYVDEKKLGNCTLSQKDVYPTYLAINQTNYNRPDVSNWDNCYLYDGNYLLKQRTSEQQEEFEEKRTSKYHSKVDAWYKKYWNESKQALDKPVPSSYEKLLDY